MVYCTVVCQSVKILGVSYCLKALDCIEEEAMDHPFCGQPGAT